MMKRPLLAAACLLTASVAVAGDNYALTVKDGDFRSIGAVKALHERITREAKDACPSYFVTRNMREISNCREEVAADLISKINHPLLNAYVEGEESLRIAFAASKASDERS